MSNNRLPNKIITTFWNAVLPSTLVSHIDWIKPTIIIAIILASLILGYMASPRWALLSIILIMGLLGFIILIRQPNIGILIVIVMSFLAPWEIGTGRETTFNLSFVLSTIVIGFWIVRILTTRSSVDPHITSITLLSIIFLSATCISLLAGSIKWVSIAQDQASIPAQVGGWLIYVLSIGIMLFMQTHIKEIKWLKILTWIYIGIGSIYIIDYISPVKVVSRLHIFPSGSVGSMYWIWLAVLAFGQFLYNNELHRVYRILLAILTLAIFYVSLSPNLREWTSGWLPPLIAVGVVFWLRSWRLCLALVLVGVIGFVLINPGFINNFLISNNQYSIVSRFATYPILFKLIQANPIIGLGFANYSHYTSLFPILGWYVSFNSHNNYMDIIAQIGFTGLIIFIGLMLAILLRGFRLSKIKTDGFSSGYINACLGGIIGMLAAGMLGDWFLPYLYNIGISGFRASVFSWIFIGGLLALERISSNQESRSLSKR